MNTLPPAKSARDQIRDYVSIFERKVKDDYDVSLIASLPGGAQFHVETISTGDGDVISFWGTGVDGEPTWVIQHVNQINLGLIAVKKPDPSTPAKRIGFA